MFQCFNVSGFEEFEGFEKFEEFKGFQKFQKSLQRGTIKQKVTQRCTEEHKDAQRAIPPLIHSV